MEKRHREVKQKTTSERKLETSIWKFAERQGMLAPKFSPMGSNGWPDRIFLYKGRAMFIEFKQQGKTLDPLQVVRQRELKANGFTAVMCDDLEQGRRYIDMFKRRVNDDSTN